MSKSREQSLMRKIRALVASYAEMNVTEPMVESVERDLSAQGRPADHLVRLLPGVRAVCQLVLAKPPDIDKGYLTSLPSAEIEKRIEVLRRPSSRSRPTKDALEYVFSGLTQNHLMVYFLKEINWIAVSILSTSYVSALILTRSCFELLVGIATRRTASMKERLDGISFLELCEKQKLLKRWNSLCAWAHPHGRWVKEVCPIYASMRPIYHPKLCTTCYRELKTVVDFFFVICLHTFGIPSKDLEDAVRKNDVSIREFELISSRLPARRENGTGRKSGQFVGWTPTAAGRELEVDHDLSRSQQHPSGH